MTWFWKLILFFSRISSNPYSRDAGITVVLLTTMVSFRYCKQITCWNKIRENGHLCSRPPALLGNRQRLFIYTRTTVYNMATCLCWSTAIPLVGRHTVWFSHANARHFITLAMPLSRLANLQMCSIPKHSYVMLAHTNLITNRRMHCFYLWLYISMLT